MTNESYEADVASVNRCGWSESSVGAHERCDRNWFRWFAGEPPCVGNEGKRLQIQLRLWDWRSQGHGYSFDMQIQAEPPGELGWMVLKVYEITDVRKIEPNIDRLLRAWRACQSS